MARLNNIPQNFTQPKSKKKILGRLLKYLGKSKGKLVVVFIALIISSLAGVAGTLMVSNLINTIQTSVETQTVLGSEFYTQLFVMIGIYVAGIICTYTYQRIMVSVSTGTLKRLRDDMFVKMQSLPIRYFDTHTNGELMSRFTNDTDVMREMISNSLPQLVTAFITIVGAFIAMLISSWFLTIIIVIMIIIMLVIATKFGGKSGKYFIANQRSVGRVNGYIEEYIEGQKVVKVFCHEDETKEGFDKLNEELRENACKANTFANMIMPIMGNISYITYAVIAMVGIAIYILTNGVALSIGTIVMFLMLTRMVSNPIGTSSQQMNVILMGLAGASRIFEVLDEEPEKDEGYVTLVNANTLLLRPR